MIITRTPMRVSFLGGGSDFPEWYLKNGGVVIGGAIDKYVYVSARPLPPYHSFRHRVCYSMVETVERHEDIQHPAVRAVIAHLGMDNDSGLEIHHASDLPGKSGTGSSSSFCVGMLNALSAMKGRPMLPHQLAGEAIRVEREVLKDTVGCQDQTWAAHGGLNVIRFERSGAINLYPIPLGREAVADLESHMMLYFTGISRNASEVSKGYVGRLATDAKMQWAMMQMADEGHTALLRHDWSEIGRLMDRAWQLKRELSGVTTPVVDRVYAGARMHGAFGGKLLGAGGGGCLLLVAPPEKQKPIDDLAKTAGMVRVPFRFEFDGSRIIFADRNSIHERS